MINRLRLSSQGLAFRITALLAIVLIPLSAIATLQTVRVFENTKRASEADLLARTGAAAAGKEALIRTAFGASHAIAAMVPVIRDTPMACEMVLRNYLAGADSYSFAGYVNADGVITCASDGVGQSVSESGLLTRMRENPVPRAAVLADPPISESSVIVMAAPVMQGDRFDGYVAISLPHAKLFETYELFTGDHPIELILFNSDGEILSARQGLEGAEGRLPATRPLTSFVGNLQTAFSGRTRLGNERVFAVVPVLSDTVYALGSWEQPSNTVAAGIVQTALPIYFPIFMWLASLGVAVLAVDRMVIRPTRDLRARMLMFMRSRHIAPTPETMATPIELREMKDTWERMAQSILHDEAELEDTIHDRNVLLREVHHRVKNNLQLIASILNLKIRGARTPEAREALGDIQQRVMSLATLHRSLYETSTHGRIRADELLRDVISQSLATGLSDAHGVKVEQHYDPLTLYPDQAVPLTLSASEAITNALKYIGRPADGPPWISISLRQVAHDQAMFELANSVGTPLLHDEGLGGSGLGEKLISAFAHQLGGTVDIRTEATRHTVTLALPINPFSTEEDAGIIV